GGYAGGQDAGAAPRIRNHPSPRRAAGHRGRLHARRARARTRGRDSAARRDRETVRLEPVRPHAWERIMKELQDRWEELLDTCSEFVHSLVLQDLRHIQNLNAFIDRLLDRL